jgi:type I restriction enzyme, S subunit
MNNPSVHPNCQSADMEYVPAGWHRKRLAEISTSIGDGIHSTPKYVAHSRFAFINGNNLTNGRICIFGSTKFVDEDEYNQLRINLSNRTILISINGTIGNLAFFQGEPVVLGKSAAYINLKKGVSREFVYHYLGSRRVSSFFDNELTGTTIRNLSLQTLRNTPRNPNTSPGATVILRSSTATTRPNHLVRPPTRMAGLKAVPAGDSTP